MKGDGSAVRRYMELCDEVRIDQGKTRSVKTGRRAGGQEIRTV